MGIGDFFIMIVVACGFKCNRCQNKNSCEWCAQNYYAIDGSTNCRGEYLVTNKMYYLEVPVYMYTVVLACTIF